MSKPRLTILLVTLALAIALPVVGDWFRRSRDSGCALDGQWIDPQFRVRIIDQQQDAKSFCCIRCAELWLARQQPETHRVLVTDESTGEEIAAESAFFVRNLVVTMPSTGNRIHVFKHGVDAENNASTYQGTVLRAEDRPFIHLK